MAGATTTAVLLGLAGAGAGMAFSKAMSPKQSMSAPTPLPQPPSAQAAGEKASEIVRKKKAMATQTIYTSPLGLAGQADVARKTLLGQ